MIPLHSLRNAVGLCLSVLVLAGCAAAPARTASAIDPWEPMNRGLYQVHETVDKVILKPAVNVYTTVTPQLVRRGVSNFFNNIEDAFSAVNGVLQGKPQKAGDDLGRVLTNTMFGLGGLIDVASGAGIERGNEDFGQTLAVWGVAQGPYLFIPVLGPSTVRDASGSAVRLYFGPTGEIHDVAARNVVYGLGVVDARYQAGDALDVVNAAALDRYTFIRNAYLQRRRYLIYDGKVPAEADDDKDKEKP
ncbi:MAG: VacJ family lipoprotein [Pseudomonadota bacterium]|nr:VacJ family lipoprotein [Pseudomonadota bacterium]